jgi:tripartite-type tricarboxylate transporter receptor subunit TctC
VNSVKHLIEIAKAEPGILNYASAGIGSFQHLSGELFKLTAGVDIQHVPYKGGGPAMFAVIAGEAEVMFSSIVQTMPNIQSGSLRALATGGEQRSPILPDLPTIAEAGVPGYSAPTWGGVIAPAGVPRPIVDKLNAAINKAILTPAFKEHFASIGDEPAGGTPEEFAALIASDSAKWGAVIKRAGIKFE